MSDNQRTRVVLEVCHPLNDVRQYAIERNSSELTSEALASMMRDLLLAAGYSPEHVKECFNVE